MYIAAVFIYILNYPPNAHFGAHMLIIIQMGWPVSNTPMHMLPSIIAQAQITMYGSRSKVAREVPSSPYKDIDVMAHKTAWKQLIRFRNKF